MMKLRRFLFLLWAGLLVAAAACAQPAADAEAEPTFETTLLPPKEDAK